METVDIVDSPDMKRPLGEGQYVVREIKWCNHLNVLCAIAEGTTPVAVVNSSGLSAVVLEDCKLKLLCLPCMRAAKTFRSQQLC